MIAHFYMAKAARQTAELRDLQAKYARTVAEWRHDKDALETLKATLRETLVRLSTHDEREAALFARLAQVEEYAARVEAERDEARKEVDEVRAALCWLEGSFFKGESA